MLFDVFQGGFCLKNRISGRPSPTVNHLTVPVTGLHCNIVLRVESRDQIYRKKIGKNWGETPLKRPSFGETPPKRPAFGETAL